MKNSKVISLSLSDTLYEQTKEIVELEKITYSELLQLALKHYIDFYKWNGLRNYAIKKAKSLDIKPENIEELIDDFREEKQKCSK